MTNRTKWSVLKANLDAIRGVVWYDLRHWRMTSFSWLWYRTKLAVKCYRNFA